MDSASGGKHEALMKILSLEAAASLEGLVRGATASAAIIVTTNVGQFKACDRVSNRKIFHSLDLG